MSTNKIKVADTFLKGKSSIENFKYESNQFLDAVQSKKPYCSIATASRPLKLNNAIVFFNENIIKFDQENDKKTVFFIRESSSILSKMYQLLKANILTDVTIRCKQDRLVAHRIALAAMSPLLESAFAPTLQGSVNKEIDLSYFDIKILKMFLEDFCYGKPLLINFNNLEKIIEAAIFFETNDVLEKCIEFMNRNKTDNNIFQLFLLARSYEQNYSCKMYLDQIKSIYQERKTENIESAQEIETQKSKNELQQFIIQLQCKKKESYSEACLRIFYWINEYRELRLEYLEDDNCVTSFLPCEYVILLKKAFKMKDLALKKIALKEYRTYFKYRIEWNEELPYAIVEGRKVKYIEDSRDEFSCYTVCTSLGELYAIDPHKDIFLHYSLINEKKMEWRNILLSPKQYQYPATTSIKGNVVLCGGYCHSNNGSFQKIPKEEVFLYELSTKKWITLASMPFPRVKGSAISIGDFLYVIGGVSDEDRHEESVPILIYNFTENKWKLGPVLTKSISFPALAVFQKMIYIFGGESHGKSLNTTFRFDPCTQEVAIRAEMNYKLTMGGTSILGNSIYVVGGFDKDKFIDIIQKYNPKLNKWVLIVKTKALQDEIDLFIW